MEMQYPSAVREILNGLHEAGYEAYIVGGSLRDTNTSAPVSASRQVK